MKHPVLARVFAVVLVIMAVILSAVSVYGIRNAVSDRKENIRVLNLLQSRTEEYAELTDTLNSEERISDLESALATMQSVYDRDKSAHRVDLATYTATRSGLVMADKMLETQLGASVSGLNMNEYTLESFAGIAPLLVYIYPELQDAANNVQAQIASATSDLREATGKLKTATDSTVSEIYQTEAEHNEAFREAAMKLGVEYKEVNYDCLNDVLDRSQKNVNRIDGLADSALEKAEEMMDYVDGFDSTVARIDQFIPQLLQLLESKEGLTETKTDLVNSKTKLDREKQEMETVRTKLDALKACDRKRTSLGVLLKTNPNIRDAVNIGGDLLTAAKAECSRMQTSVKHSFLLSLGTYISLLIAGIGACIGLPAAYEKTDSRMALVFPVILFTAFSALSEILCEINTGNRQYAGIMAAVLGLIQLLVVIPRERFPEEDS